jgi:hypothetical protein
MTDGLEISLDMLNYLMNAQRWADTHFRYCPHCAASIRPTFVDPVKFTIYRKTSTAFDFRALQYHREIERVTHRNIAIGDQLFHPARNVGFREIEDLQDVLWQASIAE